jgi:hypothetical protein
LQILGNLDQYAFPHRAKTATQGKWYALNKTPYMIESYGRKLKSNGDIIIRAKKLCKELMNEMLELGPPLPMPKPKARSFDDFDDDSSDLEEYNPLPKRFCASLM